RCRARSGGAVRGVCARRRGGRRAAGILAGRRGTAGAAARTAPGREEEDVIEIGEVTVPAAPVARLPFYLRALREPTREGVATTSSSDLAVRSGVGSAQLRKDLSYLGSFGTRGVGYDVESLSSYIAAALGLGSEHRLAIVGVGNLGHALANYSGYAARGCQMVALLDAGPAVVGGQAAGIEVEHVDRLEEIIVERSVSMVMLATPGPPAQEVAERVVSAGVREILSFAPVAL